MLKEFQPTKFEVQGEMDKSLEKQSFPIQNQLKKKKKKKHVTTILEKTLAFSGKAKNRYSQ